MMASLGSWKFMVPIFEQNEEMGAGGVFLLECVTRRSWLDKTSRLISVIISALLLISEFRSPGEPRFHSVSVSCPSVFAQDQHLTAPLS